MSAAEQYGELADDLFVPAAAAVAFAVGLNPEKLIDAVINGVGC